MDTKNLHICEYSSGVERNFAKVEAEGSNPSIRSILNIRGQYVKIAG